ncbi:helix-hairpin-helix domain-containing protein [Tautonia rosea]|uniref:helix-hairpin-helix domain-containing protein n=1 Tax=Tautonia rosea TaxID=2728037 RepID=UPI0014726D3F|nr:helix-hairpin-helix domain-containing protein [Tautonia rosea]
MPQTRPLWGWGLWHRGVLGALIMGPASVLVLLAPKGEPSPEGLPPSSMVVEINSAPPLALLALPGLGPTRVDRILSARGEGPIESLDALAQRVKGIGPTTIDGIRPFVRIKAPVVPEPPAAASP